MGDRLRARADEVPLCTVTGVDGWGAPTCNRNRAKDMRGNFCKGQADPSNCDRYQQFQALDNQVLPLPWSGTEDHAQQLAACVACPEAIVPPSIQMSPDMHC